MDKYPITFPVGCRLQDYKRIEENIISTREEKRSYKRNEKKQLYEKRREEKKNICDAERRDYTVRCEKTREYKRRNGGEDKII